MKRKKLPGGFIAGARTFSGVLIILFLFSAILLFLHQEEYARQTPHFFPGEIIVKFKPHVVKRRFRPRKRSYGGFERIAVSQSLLSLQRRFGVKGLERYFPKYEKIDAARMVTVITAEQKSQAIRKKFPRRSARAPKKAKVPELENIFIVKLDEKADIQQAVEAYRQDPAVQYAQPHFIEYPDLVPNDPSWNNYSAVWDMNQLWGLERIEAEQAWDVLDDGSELPDASSVVVAVVDSGTDYTHEDLDDNIWVNGGEIAGNGLDDDGNGYPDDVHGWDFADGDNDPSGDAHGTHVAGIVAAEGNNATGIVGVTWNAKIMPIRKGSSSGPEAIQYAADNGAHVINNSWKTFGVDNLVMDAVDYAHALGAVVVASAGNQDSDTRTQSPAQSANAIAVANFNYLDQKSGSSSYGVKVDVGAPGSVIYSTYPGDSYSGLSGTSQAAPHAAGLAALILAYDGSLSSEQVCQVIRAYADDIVDPLGDGSDLSGFDIYAGYGRINARRALEALEAGVLPLEARITSPQVNYHHTAPERYYDHNGNYIRGYFARTQVSGIISIEGVADGPGFDSYTVEYGSGQRPATWTAITTASTAVAGGVLASLDTDTLAGGTYTLRLTVENTSGQTYEDRAEINVDRAYITYPTPGQPIDEDITVTGFATGPGFVSYHFEYGEGEDPAVWNTIGGTFAAAVEDDVLLDPLEIALLPEGIVTLKLVVTETGGTSEHAIPLVIDNSHFPYQAGWPVNHGVSGTHEGRIDWNSTPAIADLDGDGQKEVVVGFGDKLYVHQTDGANRSGWPVTVSGIASAGAPTLGDIDGDGELEIGIKTYEEGQERIYLFEADGSMLAGWPMSRTTDFSSSWNRLEHESAVVFEDMDGDGVLDVVFGTFDDDTTQGQVRIYRADGSAVTGWPQITSSPVVTAPAVGDLDGDWLPEVVALTSDGHLYAWDQLGNLLTGWPQDVGSDLLHHSPLLADLDGDGDREIVAADYRGGTISAFHHDGSALTGFPQTVDLDLYQPGIGDLDGDGEPEIVVAGSKLVSIDYHTDQNTYALEAYAFNPDGTQVTGWDPRTLDADVYPGFPLLADLDEDGVPEGIFGSWSNAVRDILALKADGSLIADDRWPIRKRATFYSPLAVDDLDGDGDAELAFAGYRQESNPVAIWDLPAAYRPATVHWGTAHHDVRRTNLAQFDASAVLLFDTSGSMSWAPDGTMGVAEEESRLELTRQAAEPFLVLLNDYHGGRSNFGIATFPQHPWTSGVCESELVLPLRRVTDTSIDLARTTTLPGLEAEGRTPLLAGLERAAHMFGLETHRALILLSDGYHNCPSVVSADDPQVSELIGELQNRAITAYTIGFGRPDDIDHPLLETIASETGGAFYDVTVSWPLPADYDPAIDLQTTYKSILTEVMGLETAADPTGVIRTGETVSHQVKINEHDRRVSVFVSWVTHQPGRLGLTVKAADGAAIPFDGSGIRLHQGNTYTILTLEQGFLRLPGKVGATPWRIEIDGRQLGQDEQETYQYSVITDSALKLETGFDQGAYTTGEVITLNARIMEGKNPLKKPAAITVQVTRPQEGLGNWYAVHPVDVEQLDTIPEQRGDELLSDLQRKALYLTDIQKVRFPGYARPDTIKLYDDGSHGDAAAGDGTYTNRFPGTLKEGAYSFHFRASGLTGGSNGFDRDKVIQKHIAVTVVPEYTLIDVVPLGAVTGKTRQFTITVTPKDHLDNYLGPRYGGAIQLTASQGRLVQPVKDNLDGTYSQVLQLSPAVDLEDVDITVDIKGTAISFNLAQKLQKRYSLSLHAGITLPAGNFNTLYNGSYMLGLNLDYHFSPQLSLLGLLGYNHFKAGSPLVADTHWWNLSANLKYECTTCPLRPYVRGGAGLYIPRTGRARPGVNLGLGLDYSLNADWTIQWGTDYHHIFTGGTGTGFWVSQAGLIFRF